ncbi:MAG TPA: hypothetical protein VGQ81_04080 [Acidobacteriota bacterium]|nr:hypothetical protein [Acidobacteriota bacterium]
MLAKQQALEEKIQALMNDISMAPWEKLDPLVDYARMLETDIISLLLLLYSATTRLRIPINRAQRRKGGISVCDKIDTVHHFFFFALETYRGYSDRVLNPLSIVWDDFAARIVRGKPDEEDLLANRLGMEWGKLLRQDPFAPPSRVFPDYPADPDYS